MLAKDASKQRRFQMSPPIYQAMYSGPDQHYAGYIVIQPAKELPPEFVKEQEQECTQWCYTNCPSNAQCGVVSVITVVAGGVLSAIGFVTDSEGLKATGALCVGFGIGGIFCAAKKYFPSKEKAFPGEKANYQQLA